MHEDILVSVRGLTHRFRLNRRLSICAVDDVSLEIRRGEIFGLVGESGSGKSTLARLIMNIQRPDAGQIFFRGIETTDRTQFRQHRRELQRCRQIIFQDSASSLNPHMKVADIIAEPMAIHHIRPPRGSLRAEAAFQMKYVGLDAAAPQGFGNFLRARVFDRLPFGQVCYLNGNAPDIEAECSRYAGLLAQAPIDIVFMGIGENGHIAFNDPPVAEFDDPAAVKVVALDEVCRNQQVHDGCFADIGQVPTHALTLTVPTLAGAKHHLCIVPAPTKAKAVRDTLEGPVSTACPASILRTCPGAVLYLERESAQLLTEV